jgi:hypothetical protein
MHSSRVSPVVIAAALNACALEPESLNSERIEERFGSYGIEVLSHESGIRRSSLHSIEGDTQICRTYAVVRFVAEAHADILAGGSIGATFKSTGWQIGKVSLHVGSISLHGSDHVISDLMHIDGPAELGVHAYQLVLEKDSQTIDYATIVETHHPDYMTLPELEKLYGYNVDTNLNEEELRKLSTLIRDID